jgi:hypothetical protein
MDLSEFVAGTIGGIGGIIVGYPFDTIKVLCQTDPKKFLFQN